MAEHSFTWNAFQKDGCLSPTSEMSENGTRESIFFKSVPGYSRVPSELRKDRFSPNN